MVDRGKNYDFVVAKKRSSKWHKPMLKIKKYKKNFAKRELELENEIAQNKRMKLLINKLRKPLKRERIMAKKYKTSSKQRAKLTPQWKPKTKSYSIRATNAKHWRHKAWRDSFISELQHAMEYEMRPQIYKKATEQLLMKIKKDEEALDRINTKIIGAINDIRDMDALIDYIKKGYYNHLKLKPLTNNTSRMTSPQPQRVSPLINPTKLGERANQKHQNVFNFHSDYIPKHIPELQLTLYSYLTDNTARKHKRKKRTI